MDPKPPSNEPRSKKPEAKKEIPMNWFIGIGNKQHGIMTIAFSTEFQKLGNRKIMEYVRSYEHFMGGTKKQTSEITEEGYRKIAEEAERKIKEITGFGIQQLHEKLDELLKLYKDKHQADIEFKLF